MAETHDTIDGLLAEFRGYLAGLPANYHFTVSCHDIRVMLDRLEAAWKRERGDCAKLREALISVQKKIHYLIGTLNVPNSLVANRMEINGIINAALAAPPRNCDLYKTKEKAQEAFLEEACDHPCGNCWVEDINNECGVEWLLAPATEREGGNDGK